MATNPLSFDSGHQSSIHDAKLDYYGRLLATASSDNTIRIFQVSGGQHNYLASLQVHEGPVWQVSWSKPKNDMALLASCGYDRKIIVWRDKGKNNWEAWYMDQDYHKSSVNSVQFAPPEYGLMLLAGSSDEHVSIHSYNESSRSFARTQKIRAHPGGVNAVSWSTQIRGVQRFATGGSDGRVIIWAKQPNGEWQHEAQLVENANSEWVRDVAWAPCASQAAVSIVASCSGQDVKIWAERGGQWREQQSIQLKEKAWSVSWSDQGNVLAVATKSQVKLFKEGSDGKF